MSLLSLLMREAVADRRIGFNPAHGIRVTTGHRVARTPATAQQINCITDRIRRRSDQILVITTAYTGMRWGELAGLANTHLGDGLISIHPQIGARHEDRCRRTLAHTRLSVARAWPDDGQDQVGRDANSHTTRCPSEGL
jgi:integrase